MLFRAEPGTQWDSIALLHDNRGSDDQTGQGASSRSLSKSGEARDGGPSRAHPQPHRATRGTANWLAAKGASGADERAWSGDPLAASWIVAHIP